SRFIGRGRIIVRRLVHVGEPTLDLRSQGCDHSGILEERRQGSVLRPVEKDRQIFLHGQKNAALEIGKLREGERIVDQGSDDRVGENVVGLCRLGQNQAGRVGDQCALKQAGL